MQQHKLFLPIPQKTKREQKRIGCEKRSSQVLQLGRIKCYIIQRDSLAIFVSSSNTEHKNYQVFLASANCAVETSGMVKLPHFCASVFTNN